MSKEKNSKLLKILKKREESEYEKLLERREKWIELETAISELESELQNASIEELERIAEINPRTLRGFFKCDLYNLFGLYKKTHAYTLAAYRILKQKEGYDKDSIPYGLLDLDEELREMDKEIIEMRLSMYKEGEYKGFGGLVSNMSFDEYFSYSQKKLAELMETLCPEALPAIKSDDYIRESRKELKKMMERDNAPPLTKSFAELGATVAATGFAQGYIDAGGEISPKGAFSPNDLLNAYAKIERERRRRNKKDLD